MRAHELAAALPAVPADDTAVQAALLLSRHQLPGLAVTDEHGRLIAALPATGVLRFALPPYLLEQPCLTRVCDDDTARGRLVERLGAHPVRDMLTEPGCVAPTLSPNATAVELIEAMARQHSPLAVVRDGQEALGVVTAAHLLDHLLAS